MLASMACQSENVSPNSISSIDNIVQYRDAFTFHGLLQRFRESILDRMCSHLGPVLTSGVCFHCFQRLLGAWFKPFGSARARNAGVSVSLDGNPTSDHSRGRVALVSFLLLVRQNVSV